MKHIIHALVTFALLISLFGILLFANFEYKYIVCAVIGLFAFDSVMLYYIKGYEHSFKEIFQSITQYNICFSVFIAIFLFAQGGLLFYPFYDESYLNVWNILGVICFFGGFIALLHYITK